MDLTSKEKITLAIAIAIIAVVCGLIIFASSTSTTATQSDQGFQSSVESPNSEIDFTNLTSEQLLRGFEVNATKHNVSIDAVVTQVDETAYPVNSTRDKSDRETLTQLFEYSVSADEFRYLKINGEEVVQYYSSDKESSENKLSQIALVDGDTETDPLQITSVQLEFEGMSDSEYTVNGEDRTTYKYTILTQDSKQVGDAVVLENGLILYYDVKITENGTLTHTTIYTELN